MPQTPKATIKTTLSLLVVMLVLSGCTFPSLAAIKKLANPSSETEKTQEKTASRKNTETESNRLADYRQTAETYTIKDEKYVKSGKESIHAFGDATCSYDFEITYPQIEESNTQAEQEINQSIQDTALFHAQAMYLEPAGWMRDIIRKDDLSEPLLESAVENYVTYNDDSLISVAFNDHYSLGTYYLEYEDLSCLTFDLATGECYQETNEIITVDKNFTDLWLQKALSQEPDSFFLDAQPKDTFKNLLANSKETQGRYFSHFLIDNEGNIQVCLTYHMGNERGIARGWINVPFTPEELEPYRTDSSFWNLYDAMQGRAK